MGVCLPRLAPLGCVPTDDNNRDPLPLPRSSFSREHRHKLSSLWLPPEVAAVLDGDTPHSQRSLIMGGGATPGSNIVLTNPDMLHCSVLPYHKRFAALLSNLRCARAASSNAASALKPLRMPPRTLRLNPFARRRSPFAARNLVFFWVQLRRYRRGPHVPRRLWDAHGNGAQAA